VAGADAEQEAAVVTLFEVRDRRADIGRRRRPDAGDPRSHDRAFGSGEQLAEARGKPRLVAAR